jgi:hypothetical protein
MKEGSGNGAFLSESSVRGPWRGCSFTGDPEESIKEGSGDGHLSIGAPLGNLEEGSFTRDSER